MAFVWKTCDQCDQPLRIAYYTCEYCGYENDRCRLDHLKWIRLVRADRVEAMKLGYRTLRPYYEALHANSSSGTPFNPDHVLEKVNGQCVIGRPWTNEWMDHELS